MGAQKKFAAAWGMVTELANWNSKYEAQQRLRRSSATLKQR
jgi:hypothetical protein